MAICGRCGREASEFSAGAETPRCEHCGAPAANHPTPAQLTSPRIPAQRRPNLPATEFLIGVNVVVFVAMVASGVSFFDPTTEQLLPWGANFGPLSLGGQPWRILTCNYVHVGILHLLLNMWCLWNLGKVSEQMFGRLTFFGTYTVCGIAGSIATLWWHPLSAGAGASGAIFGLAGALITAIYLGKLPYPRSTLRSLGRSILSFAGYNLVIGFFVPIIDNAAHVGGLAMGLVLGASLAPWLTKPVPVRRRAERIIFATAVLLLLGTEMLVRRRNGYVVPQSERHESNASDGRTTADLEAIVKSRPEDATALRMLGMSYLQKKDYDKAAGAFQRLLQLRPNDVTAKYDLGLAYGSSKRFEEARQIFAELTRLDPNNDDFWQLLGSSLKELHRPTDAEGALRKAVDLNAQNFAAYRDLGWVKLELGNADAALDAFEHAATLEPNDADSQLGIARAYSAKHMEKESGAALERYNELRSSGTPATAGRF